MNEIRNTPSTSLIVLLALALALPVAAEVYRWTDKDGKVHYTSEKPPDVDAKKLKVDPPATATAPTGEANANAAPAAAPTGEAKPNDDVNAQLAALDQQRCTAAKSIATRYETAPYLQVAGADGKPRKLAIEEEAAERLKVKADVERLCKGK